MKSFLCVMVLAMSLTAHSAEVVLGVTGLAVGYASAILSTFTVCGDNGFCYKKEQIQADINLYHATGEISPRLEQVINDFKTDENFSVDEKIEILNNL